MYFEILFGVLGGIFAYKKKKEAVLYGTSLVGTFIMMHAWYLVLGGFPDEFELAERLEHGEPVELDGSFYIYCLAFFGLFVAATLLQ